MDEFSLLYFEVMPKVFWETLNQEALAMESLGSDGVVVRLLRSCDLVTNNHVHSSLLTINLSEKLHLIHCLP